MIRIAPALWGKKLRRHALVATGVVCACLLAPARADTVDVVMRGIEGELYNNVSRSLSIMQDHEESWSENQIRRLYRISRTEARNALAPFGYYNPDIEATLEPPDANSDVWQVRYDIDPGPRTTIEALRLDVAGPGREDRTLQQVLADTELHEGAPLRHSHYKATKRNLAAAAHAAGYLDAHFEPAALRVDPRDDTARIELVLNTGERYYYDRIDVEQDFLDSAFVQKFIPIQPGDPYDTDRLVDTQLILSETDYFSRVEIEPHPELAHRGRALAPWFYNLLWPSAHPRAPAGELRVPVTIHAEPSKPQHYHISAGYGTDTGPRVGFGVKFRHINEYGHQLRLDTRISAKERTLHSSYDIPIRNVVRDRLSFTGTLSNREFGDVTSNFARIGVMRDTGWALGRHKPYLKLLYERYDLDDGAGTRNTFLWYPGYTWSLRRIDDELKTRRGASLRFDIRGASKATGSGTSFLRTELNGRLIRPVTERTRLLLGGAVGAMMASDFARVPPSQRFFAGGSNSVRGYGFQKLSPKNNDTRVGGRYLAEASVEMDYRFHEDYYVAAFYDIGNAANTTGMDFYHGVGVGFRWASPVGMIRLDLAHPLDDPDTSVRIHFSIGPAL